MPDMQPETLSLFISLPLVWGIVMVLIKKAGGSKNTYILLGVITTFLVVFRFTILTDKPFISYTILILIFLIILARRFYLQDRKLNISFPKIKIRYPLFLIVIGCLPYVYSLFTPANQEGNILGLVLVAFIGPLLIVLGILGVIYCVAVYFLNLVVERRWR